MHDNDTQTDGGRTESRTEPRRTDEPRDAGREAPRDARFSRRDFLRAGAAAGAGSLALGLSETAAAAKVQEKCNTDYGKIDVAQAFTLIDNRWGMEDARQCVWLNDDGSYGYDFDASATSGGINYPEVFVGTRPWGDDTGVAEFPIRRQDVDQLELTVDVDVNVSGGEWDLAEEWWLCEDDPTVNPETHTHEIMLVLDWGGGHSHDMVERNVWTDKFGNTIDYWANYSEGGTSADFHIFRVNGGMQSGSVDLTEIVDFMSERHGVGGDLYLSGIELGNEYWTGAQGEVTYSQFDVTVNGRTYASGDGTDAGGSTGGGSTDDGSTDDGSSNDGSTDDGSTDDGSTDDGSTDDGSTDDGSDSGGDSGYPTWDPSAIYRSGDRVSWDGRVWEAQWWTQDQEPRVEDYYVWQPVTDAGSGSDGGSTDDGSSDDDSSDDGSTDDGSTDDGSTDGGSSDDGSTDGGSTGDGSSDDGSTDGGSTDSGSTSDDPIAELDPSTTSASVGEQITFRVNDTSGSGRWVDSLEVEFGDGASGSGWWNAHAYDSPGTYTAALHATDNEGTTTTHEVTITVA